jgi:hypothetical protein
MVRGNEVVLFNHPRPIASIVRGEGWSPDSLLSHGLPALSAKFTDLNPSATVFPYDPI